MKRLFRILGVVGGVVLVLAVAAGGLGVYTVRRSFPRTSGTLTVAGLEAEVEVIRDQDGIPHIYAANAHDLFLAQGYVHAQDRFYQMDFWRHQTAGRLSELYGDGTTDIDRFLRTLGWRRVAEQEYALADDAAKAVLDAYAEGVNAYLADQSPADLSLEYAVLGLTGLRNYVPEPWHPADTLAWGKAMAWDLGGNLDEEIDRALLLQAIGPDRTTDYMPLFGEDLPTILPNPALGAAPLERLHGQLAAVDQIMGERFDGIGSNNWVVAGSRTASGMPLLANDPHLGFAIPAIWYEVGLHCQPVSTACPYNVRGFSFAGVPAVIIGHNARIAWGFTNVNPDVQDLYIERINPANPNQYEVNGKWVDMTVREETISLLGGDPQTLTIRSTRHGPLITDVFGLEDFAAEAGLDPQHQYALALRWTALDPNRLFQSVFELNRAGNFDEFRAALSHFAAPAQNVVYADVDGNIGYQMPSNVPIRVAGDGLLPVPGWTDEHEWMGYIPFNELPYSYNPPQGYIATANNAVVGEDYPYLISRAWDAGYRAARIVELLEDKTGLTLADMAAIQGDNRNLGAGEVLPVLFQVDLQDRALMNEAAALRGWDYQLNATSHEAAVYMSFFNRLIALTFHDDVPEDFWPGGGGSTWLTLRQILPNPTAAWWDIQQTEGVEQRDDIFRMAWAEGLADLEARLGGNRDRWTWGQLHTTTFENETVGQSGISVIDGLFNRGPYATSGGSSIVNANGWNLARDDRDPAGDPYAVGGGPSMRMIVDLGNLDNSLTIFTTGQSGHAFHPHYIDFAEPWAQIEYHPMNWSRAQVDAAAEDVLRLVP
jgi:penicillin amidase